MFGVPLSELAALGAAIFAAGIVTGILAGMFGVGGGAVIVPVLYEVFGVLGVIEDVRLQLCVGTSLAIIIPTNVRSYLTHRAKGAVVTKVVRQWAIPAMVGVAFGSGIAAFAPASVLLIAFIAVASIVAVKMLFGRESWRVASELPGRGPMTVYGALVGLSSSMMGVSGGSMSNLILTLHGVPIHNAVATSTAVGVPITLVGTIGYALAGLRHLSSLPPLSIGFVSLIGFILMAPVSSFVAPYGARIAHTLPRRKLELLFGGFLLIVCVRYLVALVT